MKLCRFNYFLKENEKIAFFTECKLKSITNFDLLDTEGILLASDKRLIFCKLIGDHPHLLKSYEYKYISSCTIKGVDENEYLYLKYNGDFVKLMGIDDSICEEIIKLISLGYKINIDIS